eukprot:2914262-Rhodomonas_salina.1
MEGAQRGRARALRSKVRARSLPVLPHRLGVGQEWAQCWTVWRGCWKTWAERCARRSSRSSTSSTPPLRSHAPSSWPRRCGGNTDSCGGEG